MNKPTRLGSVAARLAATTRVLSVDDEHDIGDFLRAYFRASGYDLVHVDPDDVDAILTAVDEHRPDCVLLDLGLRGFDGRDAYERMRADARYDTTPVIVVTADATAEAPLAPLMAGIDGFVSKPFNVKILAGLVAQRIAAAAAATDESLEAGTGLLSQASLQATLEDQVGVAEATDAPVAFGLVQIFDIDTTVVSIGAEGTAWLTRDLVRRLAGAVPDDAVLGRTGPDEVALVLPGSAPDRARDIVEAVVEATTGTATLPGGAEVDVEVHAGLAGFPDHASDADTLYMAADAALADAADTDTAVVVAI